MKGIDECSIDVCGEESCSIEHAFSVDHSTMVATQRQYVDAQGTERRSRGL